VLAWSQNLPVRAFAGAHPRDRAGAFPCICLNPGPDAHEPDDHTLFRRHVCRAGTGKHSRRHFLCRAPGLGGVPGVSLVVAFLEWNGGTGSVEIHGPFFTVGEPDCRRHYRRVRSACHAESGGMKRIAAKPRASSMIFGLHIRARGQSVPRRKAPHSPLVQKRCLLIRNARFMFVFIPRMLLFSRRRSWLILVPRRPDRLNCSVSRDIVEPKLSTLPAPILGDRSDGRRSVG